MQAGGMVCASKISCRHISDLLLSPFRRQIHDSMQSIVFGVNGIAHLRGRIFDVLMKKFRTTHSQSSSKKHPYGSYSRGWGGRKKKGLIGN